MATSEKPKATGVLFKRQRGQNANNLKALKWQRRRIHLMPKAIEYYGMTSSVPNKQFPVDRIKIVEKIPEDTFRKKYCFQVGDEAEVIYFKAKTDDKRTKWMQAFRQIALDNGNVLLEYFHTGAYGLLSNPTRWSCCQEEKRDARGCEKIVTCSITLPRGSAMPDTMVFSEEELSDTDETDPVMEQSHESAPGPLRLRHLDTCQIQEEHEPKDHKMVQRSCSDSVKKLPIIQEENLMAMVVYPSNVSVDSGYGDGKHGSQVNLSANVSRSSSQIVKRQSASSTWHSHEAVLHEKGCQTDEQYALQDLVKTISNGDIQSLRTIIDQGLDPNMDLWEGCHKTTLLNLACEYGQEKLVNVIISEQTELHIDCQDELGKTPLMVAAKKGLQSIVDILIERGSEVGLQSFDERTALHEAAEGGHLEIVHKLLQNGADPLVCAGGHRPYDLAISQGHTEVAEALLDKTPKKLVPYTLTNSIQLHSKVGSLRFIGSGKIVVSTDSEVSSIDTNLQSTSEFLVNKISTGSVASLDLWKDTLILGSSCIEFVNVKQFEWKLRYEESEEMQNGQNLVAVTPHGKLVSSSLRGTTLRIWEPAITKDQLESTRIAKIFIPSKDIRVIQADKVYSLSISMDRNAPYIAVGVTRHLKHEILIYNYEKKADQPPCPIIKLGKASGDLEDKSVQTLSPSGRIVASGIDQMLEMFSVTTGEKLHTFSNFGNGSHISSICFSPAGSQNKHLLVGLSTGDIKVFSHDLKEGLLFTLQQPNMENSGVTALTYSQDTLSLASGHQNGFVNIWKVPVSRNSAKSSKIQTQKFVVDSDGREFISKNDDYGFIIPSGALDKATTITHGLIPFGEVACHFPEKITPVSNMMLICPDQTCDPIFRVEISSQHCLNLDLTNPDNLKDIMLLKANHCKKLDKTSVLNFDPVQGAKIYPSQDLRKLTAQVSHCCAFCFGIKTREDTDHAVRFNIVEIKPKSNRKNNWRVDYCLSYVFETCMEELQHRHPEEDFIITPYTIEFSPTQDGIEPHIELDITEPAKLGWKVSILGSKQITKRSVNFWEYYQPELVELQLTNKFPPRVTLEVDASKAKKDTSMELSFKGVTAFPGKEALCVTLQLVTPRINTNENLITRPTLNGLVVSPRPVHSEHNTTHLKVLRQHHAALVRLIESLEKFTTLLPELYTKEVIDRDTYEKFLMKQESNPNCPPGVLSGLLLLDVQKHLEGKAHNTFLSFCECVEKVDNDFAQKLNDEYNKLQPPPEEAHSQEVSETGDDSPHGHEGNIPNFGREEATGLQPAVKPF